MAQPGFKQKVWQHCCNLLEQRIANARQAMAEAQEGANSNDKSSAGDKYETSRAMGQLDRDMNARQMAGAQAELDALRKLNIDFVSDRVIAGSMVETDRGMYFIAAGIGAIDVEEQKVFVLSPRAPLATIMTGKKCGDDLLFNAAHLHIQKIR